MALQATRREVVMAVARHGGLRIGWQGVEADGTPRLVPGPAGGAWRLLETM
jgi:hypothetical protein